MARFSEGQPARPRQSKRALRNSRGADLTQGPRHVFASLTVRFFVSVAAKRRLCLFWRRCALKFRIVLDLFESPCSEEVRHPARSGQQRASCEISGSGRCAKSEDLTVQPVLEARGQLMFEAFSISQGCESKDACFGEDSQHFHSLASGPSKCFFISEKENLCPEHGTTS